jgi:hypothetical protein
MPSESNANEVNHVYILGAGFSYPMGGPLFQDLFIRNAAFRFLNLKGTEDPQAISWRSFVESVEVLADTVRGFPILYQLFTERFGQVNAERFLELCDCSLDDRELWSSTCLLDSFVRIPQEYRASFPPEKIRELLAFILKASKIRLAIETNYFLENVPDSNDRWQPYIRWFPSLGKTDTIITLNYDLLVETVAEKVDRPFPGRQFNTKDDLIAVDELMRQNEAHPDQPLLCKLHGSVDFIEKNGVAYAKRYNIDDYFHGDPPLLGTPGTGKVSLSKGSLERVWLTALERLRDADVISIVGYSLPETDNDFRIKLLDKIVGTFGNLRAINIVVGSPSPQSQRARAILEQATRLFAPDDFRPTVNLLPIYAQDYLPFYRPKRKSHIERHAFPRV